MNATDATDEPDYTTTNLNQFDEDDCLTFETAAPGVGVALDETEAVVLSTESESGDGAILGPYRKTTLTVKADDGDVFELRQYETKDDGTLEIRVAHVNGMGAMNTSNGNATDVSEVRA